MNESEWMALARNYVRAYRGNEAREGFTTAAVIEYSSRFCCPPPADMGWWDIVIEREGLEQASGVWRAAPCCRQCAG